MVATAALLLASAGTLALRRELDGRLTTGWVYRVVYAGSYGGVGKPDMPGSAVQLDTFFVRGLIQSFDHASIDEPGWTVDKVIHDEVVLTFDGVRVVTKAEAVKGPLDPGADVVVSAPAVRIGTHPGFVTRLGGLSAEVLVSRIYLAAREEHAPILLKSLADALASAGVPYLMKVAGHPASFARCDACVIYVRSWDEDAAVDVTLSFVEREGVALRNVTPLLTLEVNRGIAVADDPSDVASVNGRPMSHGQWVASLLMRASADRDDPSEIADAVIDLIEASGRSVTEPYRRATAT